MDDYDEIDREPLYTGANECCSVVPVDNTGIEIRQDVLEAIKDCNWDEYWFNKFFYKPEKSALWKVIESEGLVNQIIKILDIGSGTGRVSAILLNLVNEIYGDQKSRKIANNLHCIDMSPHCIARSRKNLAQYGVPESNIIEGNFMSLPEELQKGDFTILWAMMNTLFYCINESQISKSLENFENALAPGGIFLFDTIKLEHTEKTLSQDVLTNFKDLKNFYSVLLRVYQNQNPTKILSPSGYPLNLINTNTTGKGLFYDRAVYSVEYIQDILQNNGSSLKLTTSTPIEKTITPEYCITEIQELGLKWIDQNNIEQWLRSEIAYRISQDKSDEIKPLFTLSLNEQKRATQSLGLSTPEIDSIIEDIAICMVQNYTKQYYVFKKKNKPTLNNSSRTQR